ncbi:MAG: hypothetical protein Q4F43_09215, partial [Eubacteriales bacterium]|nr:hypothetical protein [Eubacteriales bacterium]
NNYGGGNNYGGSGNSSNYGGSGNSNFGGGSYGGNSGGSYGNSGYSAPAQNQNSAPDALDGFMNIPDGIDEELPFS